MRRIVVTGMGAVTPLAAEVEASWTRLLAGRSGIRRLPDDVVGDLPAKIGGVVPSVEEDPEAGFDPNTGHVRQGGGECGCRLAAIGHAAAWASAMRDGCASAGVSSSAMPSICM